MRRAVAVLAVWCFIGGAGRASAEPKIVADEVCTLTFSNGVRLEKPNAKTDSAQTKGLSGLADVRPGMLFSWPTAEPRAIWMHATHQPLEAGFFDADGTLFLIEEMAADTDAFHLSMKPALDALELPAGGFANAGLSVGVRLIGRACKPQQ